MSASMPRAVERIDAATPARRDRAVDALRAMAILGVVLGHWMVTALVADGHRLDERSPLSWTPGFVPVSWVLQTLAVFFFVGGFAGARSLRRPYGSWVRTRMARLWRPAALLVVVWAPVTFALDAAGLPPGPLVSLMLSPLWFLGVYAGLTALTPLLARLPRWSAAVAGGIVALVDLARFVLGAPAWVGWSNVLAGWLVPYLLGMAWANGALATRRSALALLAGGVTGTALLIVVGGYPASMVGVPGAAVSNLSPPTLAAVTFGVAQAGLALLVRERLGRLMRRPLAWAVVALANLSAMTVFCWHQTAFMLVTVAGLGLGRLPGLHDTPDHPLWALERVVWLPAFAAALGGLWAVFHRFERPADRVR